jgi:hypothetical protein
MQVELSKSAEEKIDGYIERMRKKYPSYNSSRTAVANFLIVKGIDLAVSELDDAEVRSKK